MTIYEIAKLAGVSISTVSRVLNEKPGVKESIRKNVEQIIAENNYRPSLFAQGLMSNKSKVIGIVMPGIHNYFSPRIDAVNELCKEKGYSLIITANYSYSNEVENDIQNLTTLVNNKIDGLIYFASRITKAHEEILKKISRSVPVVMIDNCFSDENIPAVLQDNVKGTSLLMNHLIDQGHRKIAFIKGIYYDRGAAERFKTYRKILKEHDIPFNPDYVAEGSYSIDSGIKGVNEILGKVKKLPSAIFCSNDLMAVGAMKAVKDRGLDIPGDISIVGYDNIEISRSLSPALTTVSIDQYRVGKISAQMLFNVLEKKQVDSEVFMVKPELIIRESVTKHTP